MIKRSLVLPFLFLTLFAHAQNGFVVTGTLSSKPEKYEWLPNNILVSDNAAYDTTGLRIATGSVIKHVGDDIIQVQIVDYSWGYDPEFPFKVTLQNSRKENILKREFILYYFGKLSGGMIPMGQKDQSFGFINTKGDTIIPFKFSGARSFSNGRAAVRVGSQNWTLIDEKGNQVLPSDKERGFGIGTAGEFEKGFSIITAPWEPKKFSVANDKSFKPLIPYHGLQPEIISRFIIARGSTIYLYNEALDTATEFPVKNFSHLGDGHFYAEENGVPGIYNPNGKLAFKKSPDYKLLRFNGKVYNAYNNISKAYCLLDTSGKEIFSCTQFKFSVSDMRGLSNGYTAITADGVTGIIDDKGKLVVPLQFTGMQEKAFETSKYMFARYNGVWSIVRLKTPAELKKEQLLITQKKLPTADQCFANTKSNPDGIMAKPIEKTQVATTNKTVAKDNSFAENNTKDKILERNLAQFGRHFSSFNESSSKYITAMSKAIKTTQRNTCTNEDWSLMSDAYRGVIGLQQALDNMLSDIEQVKEIDYNYLCPANKTKLLSKISDIRTLIERFNRYEKIKLESDVKQLRNFAAEGKSFGNYFTELKSQTGYQTENVDPRLNEISTTTNEFFKLIESCK